MANLHSKHFNNNMYDVRNIWIRFRQAGKKPSTSSTPLHNKVCSMNIKYVHAMFSAEPFFPSFHFVMYIRLFRARSSELQVEVYYAFKVTKSHFGSNLFKFIDCICIWLPLLLFFWVENLYTIKIGESSASQAFIGIQAFNVQQSITHYYYYYEC